MRKSIHTKTEYNFNAEEITKALESYFNLSLAGYRIYWPISTYENSSDDRELTFTYNSANGPEA